MISGAGVVSDEAVEVGVGAAPVVGETCTTEPDVAFGDRDVLRVWRRVVIPQKEDAISTTVSTRMPAITRRGERRFTGGRSDPGCGLYIPGAAGKG